MEILFDSAMLLFPFCILRLFYLFVHTASMHTYVCVRVARVRIHLALCCILFVLLLHIGDYGRRRGNDGGSGGSCCQNKVKIDFKFTSCMYAWHHNVAPLFVFGRNRLLNTYIPAVHCRL